MRLNLKVILLFLTFLLIPMFTYAQDCQIAIPRYGIVQCVNTSEDKTIVFDLRKEYNGKWSVNTLDCLSHCRITKKYIHIRCRSSHTEEYEFIKNKVKINNTFPIEWERGDKLIFNVRCIGSNISYSLLDRSYIKYDQKIITLYEGWNKTTLKGPIDNTDDCSYTSFKRAEVDTFLDPRDGTIRVKPESTYKSLNRFPEHWKVGDYYVYVKAWETDLGNISPTYDKYGNYYWCNGEKGSRILYNIESVYDPNGKCYDVPKSILFSDLECCFDSDCEYLGENYVCDPSTWNCKQTRWCDSSSECKAIFGNDSCRNGRLSMWKCNIYEPWGNYEGTCIKDILNVEECPQDCKDGYDYEKGKCLIEEEKEDILIQGYVVSDTVRLDFSLLQKVILLIFMIVIVVEVIYYLKK